MYIVVIYILIFLIFFLQFLKQNTFSKIIDETQSQ